MKNSDLQELIDMSDEALEAIEKYERGSADNNLLKKINSVGVACLDGEKINSQLNEKIPFKSRYDFSIAVFHLVRLFSVGMSNGVGTNQNTKASLNNVKSIIQDVIKNSAVEQSNFLRVFYSWQATLPNKTNRNFIGNSIGLAIKELKKQPSFKIKLDSDTKSVAGSPDIINTILEKINNSDVFIADVSIVNKTTPNPNVMFELGYAMKALGDSKIIMIFNEAYGSTRDLPFDLGFKRQMLYNVTDNSEDISEKRKELGKRLANAIAEINKSK